MKKLLAIGLFAALPVGALAQQQMNQGQLPSDTRPGYGAGAGQTGQGQVIPTQPSERGQVAPEQPSGQQAMPNQPPTMQGGELSSSDRAFIMKAAQTNLAEVKLGKLAQEKGTSKDVKDLADRLVDDHSKALDQLKAIADKNNISVTDQLSSDQQALYDRLSKLSGAEFDKTFTKEQVKLHNQAISLYTDQAKNGTNPDLKSYAQAALPTLRAHSDMLGHGHHHM
jgi:putative membrane protein